MTSQTGSVSTARAARVSLVSAVTDKRPRGVTHVEPLTDFLVYLGQWACLSALRVIAFRVFRGDSFGVMEIGSSGF